MIRYLICGLTSFSAVVAGCFRFVYIRALRGDTDISVSQGKAMLLTVVENNMAITCNCAILLGPFLRRHIPWLLRRNRQAPEQHRPVEHAAVRTIGGHALRRRHGSTRTDRPRVVHESAELGSIVVLGTDAAFAEEFPEKETDIERDLEPSAPAKSTKVYNQRRMQVRD